MDMEKDAFQMPSFLNKTLDVASQLAFTPYILGSPEREGRALIGRVNTDSMLTPSEKELVPFLPKDDKTYLVDRIKTDPIVNATVGGGVVALGHHIARTQGDYILNRIPEMYNQAVAGGAQVAADVWLKPFMDEKFTTYLRNAMVAKPLKPILQTAAAMGGLVLAKRLLYPRYVQATRKAESTDPAHFIRQKLRDDEGVKQAEFPVALVDDAVVLALRIANNIHPAPHEPKEKVPTKEVLREIKNFEKNAGKPSPVLNEAFKAMLQTKGNKNVKSRSNNAKDSRPGQTKRVGSQSIKRSGKK